MMPYILEKLKPNAVDGLPLYPYRVSPDHATASNYTHVESWCKERGLSVHIPNYSFYFYFTKEQDAALFLLGYTND